MWKPRVSQASDGCWTVAGMREHFISWRRAYKVAYAAAARFAGREVPC